MNCPRCGYTMKMMRFVDELSNKLTCPDCGHRNHEKDSSFPYIMTEAEFTALSDVSRPNRPTIHVKLLPNRDSSSLLQKALNHNGDKND